MSIYIWFLIGLCGIPFHIYINNRPSPELKDRYQGKLDMAWVIPLALIGGIVYTLPVICEAITVRARKYPKRGS